jgi:GNAT superfamily N-acetyltransferase
MTPFASATPALAAALLTDPFYQAITVDQGVDTSGRLALLCKYFEYSLQEADRAGRCVFHEDPRLGAAAWLLPRAPDVEAAEARAKTEFLARLLGPKGWDNYRRIIDFMSAQSERLVPAEAWYLTIVGIDPSAQGRGIGARLLAPTLAEAAAAGAYTFLETFSPRNLTFYERIGFVRVADFLEPTTQSRYFIMGCRPKTVTRAATVSR